MSGHALALVTVVEPWLRHLAATGHAAGWQLEQGFLPILGHDQARGLVHRILQRFVGAGWVVPSALPSPSDAQRALLGPAALAEITREAEAGTRIDLSVFAFTPGSNEAFRAWAGRLAAPRATELA